MKSSWGNVTTPPSASDGAISAHGKQLFLYRRLCITVKKLG